MKENMQLLYPGPFAQFYLCFVHMSTPPFNVVLHFTLPWGFPPEVYFTLQKENLDLEVIKALIQLENPNRVIWGQNWISGRKWLIWGP